MTREMIHPELGPTPEQLAAFADGELSAPAQEQVQAWLADHPEGRAEVEALRSFMHAWRSCSPDEPSPEAWDHALAQVASAVSPEGPVGPPSTGPKPRWRPRWPTRVVGALLAAAAVLGGVLIARPVWGPRPQVVAPVGAGAQDDERAAKPGPKPGTSPEAEADEPFPVVSAAEVHIISVHVSDADSLVLGQPRFLDTFELASPRDIQVLAVEPHQADGPMPRLEEGSVPMIVLSAIGGRAP